MMVSEACVEMPLRNALPKCIGAYMDAFLGPRLPRASLINIFNNYEKFQLQFESCCGIQVYINSGANNPKFSEILCQP